MFKDDKMIHKNSEMMIFEESLWDLRKIYKKVPEEARNKKAPGDAGKRPDEPKGELRNAQNPYEQIIT